MNLYETGLVYAKVAAIDNRKTTDAAIMAWQEILHDQDLQNCLVAVSRHRVESPGVYIEPGHVRRLAKLIRDERRAGTVIAALPSAPPNPSGAARVRQLLAELAAKRSVPGPDKTTRPPTREESIHARALARARGERRTTKEK